MANYSVYNYWEIMNCDLGDCPARFESETPCWEIAQKIDTGSQAYVRKAMASS